MNTNKVYCLLFLLMLVRVSFGQSDLNSSFDSIKEREPEELDEVVVTATRTERKVSSLPLPVKVIGIKDIRDSNTLRLADILNEQTGIITVPDFGGGEGVQLQGIDSEYILVLVDGVPLIGRSAGTLDLNRIAVGNIKQIEVVKGASSSLYGSEAIGGVINIITESPKGHLNGNIGYLHGTYNRSDFNATVNHRFDKLGVGMFLNRNSFDGFDVTPEDGLKSREAYQNYTGNAKVTYDFNENTDLFISTRYFTQNQDINSTLDIAGEGTIDEWNAHLRLSHKYKAKWNSYFEFYTSNYKTEETTNNKLDGSLISHSFYDASLMRFEGRGRYTPLEGHDFITGLGYNTENLDRTYFLEIPNINTVYGYLQYELNAIDNLNVIAGARFDIHNQFEDKISPKLAVKYDIADWVSVKSSLGYGFKTPDFRQLYFDFTNASVGYTVLGTEVAPTAIRNMLASGEIASASDLIVPLSEIDNLELQPETSQSINLGFDFSFDTKLKFSFNAFQNNINNLIDTRVIAVKSNGLNALSYYNVAEVRTRGLEFDFTYQPLKQLRVLGGYQLLYAKDLQAIQEFKDGNVYAKPDNSPTIRLSQKDYFGLPNRSRHTANLKVFYDVIDWGLDANMRALYRSEYALTDSNGNGYVDIYDDFVSGFVQLNGAVNKTFSGKYVLGLGVDNILNYTDPLNLPGIPGRTYYAKFNFNF